MGDVRGHRGRKQMTDDEIAFRRKFSEMLVRELDARGISQTLLANWLGMATANVNRWCRGFLVPSLYRWWQIQKIFRDVPPIGEEER